MAFPYRQSLRTEIVFAKIHIFFKIYLVPLGFVLRGCQHLKRRHGMFIINGQAHF